MQYVACKLRPEDVRSYTYHNDGEPVAAGDIVKVPDRSGDGWKRVEVVSISDAAPSFPTKPILGKLEDEPKAAAESETESAAGSADDADNALLQSFLEDK